jgi:hypothetical protein
VFGLPATPSCRVIYNKGGVSYAGVLNPTPKSNDELQRRLLDRKVGISQVDRLEPIEPRGDLQHNHPAAYQMSQYQKISDWESVLTFYLSWIHNRNEILPVNNWEDFYLIHRISPNYNFKWFPFKSIIKNLFHRIIFQMISFELGWIKYIIDIV